MKNLNVKKVVILNEGDKIASRFCSDIRKINVLSRESEIEYFKVYQKTKCSKAREKIINANQKFVVSIARKYINSSNCHYLPDLINEGSIGLIEAIETFDVNRGYKFISYAVHYIRRSINEFLLTQVPIIKKPCLDVTAYIEPKIREKYMNTNGYEISNDEMLSEIQKIDNSVKNVYSLNVEYIDDDYNVHDTSNIESTFENEHNKLIAAELMNILLPFEKDIIESNMGFNDKMPVSLRTISSELKCHTSVIQKVYINAIKKMAIRAKITKIKNIERHTCILTEIEKLLLKLHLANNLSIPEIAKTMDIKMELIQTKILDAIEVIYEYYVGKSNCKT